ncbi:MAG TPA: TMEM175 family protein [Pyrinomonadaceae bacterium]|nr:TMEM175 family protein [Pyrinomonadaceae bacterium]
MGKGRLEAFSDGVLAIIITIMVLELKVPHGTDLAALRMLVPVFLSYVLSFIFVGIYWSNHHHLIHAARHVNGRILWANLHLLFWLSLIPFVTGWMGENHFAAWPVALYGVVLLCAAIAYYILARTLIAHHGSDSALARALGRDFKGKLSVVIYVAAISLAFLNPWLSCALYVVVAVMWLIPDRRIEHTLVERDERASHEEAADGSSETTAR